LSVPEQQQGAAAQAFANALGYVIQNTATAINTTWSGWTGTSNTAAAAIASFKPASYTPPSSGTNARRSLLGIGQ